MGQPAHQFYPDPELPIRIRRPVHLLTDAEVARLERAYQLQKDLPDSDPRSFTNQAKLHCLYCDSGIYYPDNPWPLEIHNGWFFFPWHRMFLYFHERILAKLLDDDTFALPFWNWDNQTPEEPYANVLPISYAKSGSPLWNQQRNKCAEPPLIIDLNTIGGCTAKSPSVLRTENDRIMYTQVVSGAMSPQLFYGMPYRYGDAGGHGPGTFEDNPHGTVHLWVGNPDSESGMFDDMGNFGRAARDPIFYAHHSNVDRIWTVWNTLPGEQRKAPVDPDFLDARFTFFDENGDLIIVNVSQTLDNELLRFRYEQMPTGWVTNGQLPGEENSVPLCYRGNPTKTRKLIADTPYFKPSMVLHTVPLTFKVQRPRRRPEVGVEVLELSGLSLIPALQAHWEAFLFLPNGNNKTTVSCPEFIGTFNYVAHVGQALFNRERRWRVALGPKIMALGKENYTDVVITLAQFGPNIQPITFERAVVVFDTDGVE